LSTQGIGTEENQPAEAVDLSDAIRTSVNPADGSRTVAMTLSPFLAKFSACQRDSAKQHAPVKP
jgi:hypothetical protein